MNKPAVYSMRGFTGAALVGRGAVKIDRSSPYGNPFVIGRDGDREEVINKFRTYALERLQREPDWLKPLVNKDVLCWCKPLPCHGDVILELVEGRYGAQ